MGTVGVFHRNNDLARTRIDHQIIIDGDAPGGCQITKQGIGRFTSIGCQGRVFHDDQRTAFGNVSVQQSHLLAGNWLGGPVNDN